jgi:type VI secretion system FHA domain protein
MALRLEVISSQRQQLGGHSSIVLGVAGGSIGRGLDNDWALPDPQRYLSGRHARVHFRQGSWQLEDCSTNGVFINNATTALGRRSFHTLKHGDTLRMGDYRLRVTIDVEVRAGAYLPSPGTGTIAQMSVDNVVPLRAVGAGYEADDLGASLNIEALMPPDSTGPVAKLGMANSAVGGQQIGSALSAQQRLMRLRAAARVRLEGVGAPLADIRNGMHAFCRGAGIDPGNLPMESEARSLHLAGRLLREAVIGLKEVMRAQQNFRNRYHIEMEKADGRSPLDLGTDEYLLELFAGHEKRELDAVLQLRGQLDQASNHAAVMDPAVRSALAQFMAHLAPTRMEAGATDAESPGGTGSWERYKDIYSNLLQSTGDEVPHLFVEAIAQAFLQGIKDR